MYVYIRLYVDINSILCIVYSVGSKHTVYEVVSLFLQNISNSVPGTVSALFYLIYLLLGDGWK